MPHIIIESHWRDERWEGDVDVPGENPLEAIFRLFNRVDDGDHERMAAIGYTLPSLSVNDHVTIDGQRWRCAPAGWELT
jgi:hypothetical protein